MMMAQSKDKVKLTKMGLFVLGWFVVMMGIGIMGLLGWLSEMLPLWVESWAGMNRAAIFGVFAVIGMVTSPFPFLAILFLDTNCIFSLIEEVDDDG